MAIARIDHPGDLHASLHPDPPSRTRRLLNQLWPGLKSTPTVRLHWPATAHCRAPDPPSAWAAHPTPPTDPHARRLLDMWCWTHLAPNPLLPGLKSTQILRLHWSAIAHCRAPVPQLAWAAHRTPLAQTRPHHRALGRPMLYRLHIAQGCLLHARFLLHLVSPTGRGF